MLYEALRHAMKAFLTGVRRRLQSTLLYFYIQLAALVINESDAAVDLVLL